ncbi:MAG: hydroxymethylglutaryl-CoA lyase [Deltaproteobacteria bacterium]|nr:hydroxymethylglutaryl-CoA lyase [Deltaproteobacteria bacterium]
MDYVTINEVGLRDGLQNQPVIVTTEGKIALVRALIAAGVKHIEATSFVSPKAVPQMADAADLYKKLPENDGIAYSALVPNLKGYERAVEAGVKSVAFVIAASDTMNKKNINMSLEQTKSACRDVIRHAKKDGVISRTYISGMFICPFEGPIPDEHIVDLAEELLREGTDEVIIADPLGLANPTRVYHLFCAFFRKIDLGRISAHFHDTRAMALANVWAALQVGVRKFDSSIGGLGGCPFAPGASGNLATEDLVLMLSQCGYDTGIDVEKLRASIKVAEDLLGRSLGGRTMAWFDSRSSLLPISY